MAFFARLDARDRRAEIWRDESRARGDRHDADTRLVLFTPDGHENRIGTDQNVVFWTDDVEKTWKTLSGKGVTFTAPPKKEPWGTFAIFQDPDGNRFVLGTK